MSTSTVRPAVGKGGLPDSHVKRNILGSEALHHSSGGLGGESSDVVAHCGVMVGGMQTVVYLVHQLLSQP